ncbi:hypothetical protein HNR60_000691 [Rhodopseudomonas rhenobacensis]|uniref:Uncharacterized protein n=1 Tax=Rhodopseudomonas rhenobacensis TaxID=87461 RepID=A0A7W7Z0X4_9BRAD|nr:hypothetical protein [Rhodopseudomonas rhenobacensis]MBB5045956.1 hypothetical protein [Rhodopseudomonas rhenobacensis]
MNRLGFRIGEPPEVMEGAIPEMPHTTRASEGHKELHMIGSIGNSAAAGAGSFLNFLLAISDILF